MARVYPYILHHGMLLQYSTSYSDGTLVHGTCELGFNPIHITLLLVDGTIDALLGCELFLMICWWCTFSKGLL